MKDSDEKQYSYRRSAFGESSSPFALVTINGQEISKKHSVSVDIHQKMLEHTEYILKIPSEAFNDKNTYPMENSQKLLGTDLSIQFRQHARTVTLFTGQVTGVEYKRANKYPFIIIYGKSYTVQIDAFSCNRSYQNMTLEAILNDVKKEYIGNKIDFIIAPKNKDIIAYTVSYNETAFEFIRRLARKYGEYLFWNGSQLVFGRGNQYSTELKEGRDFLEYSLKTYTQSQHLTYKNYYPQSAEEQTVKSSDISRGRIDPIVNNFQGRSVEASQKMYPEPERSFYFDSLSEEDNYTQIQKIEAHQDSLQNLVTAEVQSTNPCIRLGDIVKMSATIADIKIFKEKGIPIESYLIQEIQIHYSIKGYRNSFKSIPREQKTAPYWDIMNSYPKAPDQTATVISNDDPLQMNRIKLRFPWQKQEQSTPWVRLVQGYAGPDRGMHIIPEEGEEVLVSFRGGNAEVPVVTGSLYNGKQKSGYHTPGNDLKTIHTRSGTKRVANDAEGSIREEDAPGSYLKLEGDGNITLNALETLTINCKNMNINVQQDMNTFAGKNKTTNVGGSNFLTIGMNYILKVFGIMQENITGDLISHTDKNRNTTSKKEINTYSEGFVKNNSDLSLENNSEEKTHLF